MSNFMWRFKVDYGRKCELESFCAYYLTDIEHDNIRGSLTILVDAISDVMYEDYNYLTQCKVRANLVNKQSVLRGLRG